MLVPHVLPATTADIVQHAEDIKKYILNVTKEMERKIQKSLIDGRQTVVIGLLVVAIVLLVGIIALGAYNMKKNKAGFEKVN